jgi:hypothetical protein
MLGALALLVSPVSQFLLWCAPFFAKGSRVEWILLAAHCVVPVALLVFAWRGRMGARLSLRGDMPVFVVPLVLHASDLVCARIGGYTEILLLEVLFTVLHCGIVMAVVLRGRGVGPDRAGRVAAVAAG